MKVLCFVFLLTGTGCVIGYSQNEAARVPPETLEAVSAAHLIGDLPNEAPPSPKAPEPPFVVPAEDVLDTEIHEEGGRKIIVQQIEPIDLPPPPESIEENAPDFTAFRQNLAEVRAGRPAIETLTLEATVYRSENSAPRSLVMLWQANESGTETEIVRFWSSADLVLLSGVPNFAGSDGVTRNLMLSCSAQHLDSLRRLSKKRGRVSSSPEIPHFPEGNATFSLLEGKPTQKTLAAVQSLHDLYNNEYSRLKSACDSREQARLDAEAELKAHPPKPKDIVINHWRIGDAAPSTLTQGADQ